MGKEERKKLEEKRDRCFKQLKLKINQLDVQINIESKKEWASQNRQ